MQQFWYKKSNGLRILNVALIAGVLELPILHVLIAVFLKPLLGIATGLELAAIMHSFDGFGTTVVAVG